MEPPPLSLSSIRFMAQLGGGDYYCFLSLLLYFDNIFLTYYNNHTVQNIVFSLTQTSFEFIRPELTLQGSECTLVADLFQESHKFVSYHM